MSDSEFDAHRFSEWSPLHTSKNLLYYYRRLPGNRMLFGARGDFSGCDRNANRTKRRLQKCFIDVFPNWRDVSPEFFWRGLVSVTRRLAPSLGQLDGAGSAWFGFGCHGNGINNQTWMGREVAHLVAGRKSISQVPTIYRGLPAALPASRSVRRVGLGVSYGFYSIVDRLNW